jgi:hypothetical protein
LTVAGVASRRIRVPVKCSIVRNGITIDSQQRSGASRALPLCPRS